MRWLSDPTQHAMFTLMFGIFKLVASTTLATIGGREYVMNEAATPVTWYEASRICMDIHGSFQDSHLAVLDTQDKIKNISDELMTVIGVHDAWLGAKPKIIDEWIFLNGTVNPAEGAGLFEETSDNELDGNCLTIQGSRYKVRNCDTRTASYLCEFNRSSDTFCLNMSDIMERVCVKIFNSTDISWFEARQECQDKGGDLASFDLTDNSLPGDFRGTAHVGAHRNPWWWTNPASEVKYYKWQNGNETYRIDSCLAISRTGWVPRHCNKTMKYFICEGKIMESDEITIIPTSSSGTNQPNENGRVKDSIIWSLVGGLILLVAALIVVLVLCLRLARKRAAENRESGGNGGETTRGVTASNMPSADDQYDVMYVADDAPVSNTADGLSQSNPPLNLDVQYEDIHSTDDQYEHAHRDTNDNGHMTGSGTGGARYDGLVGNAPPYQNLETIHYENTGPTVLAVD